MIPAENLEIQRKLDIRAMRNAGGQMCATDIDVTEICDWDPSVCEEQLERWHGRHEMDSDVVGRNPLKVKIYPTINPDRENRILFEKRQQKRKHARKRAGENKQWDSMFSEGFR